MSTIVNAHVRGGVIVPDDRDIALPEGKAVTVHLDEAAPADMGKSINKAANELADWLESFPIIEGEGLPADASIQHDHYLYGTPKRTDV
jgi:hypothetical protein